MSKKILAIFAILMVVVLVATPVLADVSMEFPSGTGTGGKITASAKKVWKTVTTIVQMLAFAAVIFAGVRYMFASADQKADIKKGLGMLALGAILVFAASTVVKFIVGAANDVIGGTTL